ncbi:hypothetical protein J1614_009870 [Plenodomus biglobosus]|nr:hypothetical protein J1614_009870 [Plenodomus biglobosus]
MWNTVHTFASSSYCTTNTTALSSLKHLDRSLGEQRRIDKAACETTAHPLDMPIAFDILYTSHAVATTPGTTPNAADPKLRPTGLVTLVVSTLR